MLDSFGRSGGGSPSPKDLMQQLLGSTKSVMSGGGSSDGMDNLYSAVNSVALKIDKTASRELQESRRLAQSVSRLHRELRNQSKSDREDNKTQKKQSGDLKSIERSINKLYSEAKKQNTLWVGVSKFGNKGYNQIVKAIQQALGKASSAQKNLAGSSRNPGAGKGVQLSVGTPGGNKGGKPPKMPGGSSGGGGGMGGAAGAMAWEGAALAISAAATSLARVGDSFMNALDLNLGNVFDGLIKDENIFKENMRQIVYQTEGLTGANRELEKQYFDINGLVQRTGYNRSEFQKLWMKNMERGYKVQNKNEARDMKTAKGREKLRNRHVRDMKEITVTALHTSKATGISADNLNDMFQNMQFGMSMSANQVQMVATGMKSIARDMGITGDQLGKAIAQAEKLMQKMADAGTLTAEAAEGLNRTMAAATKHNVEGLAAKLTEATTDFDGWLNSSDEMKRLLRLTSNQAGLNMQGIMTGAQTRDEYGQRELLTGMGDTLQSTFSNIAGDLRGIAPGIQEDLDAGKFGDVIQKLNAAGRSDIAMRLEATFKRLTGVGIGEAQRFMTMVEDRNKSHRERMLSLQEKYDKAIADGSVSTQRELASRMAGANMDMVSQVGRQMQELRDGGMNFAEAQQQMYDNLSGQFMEEGMSRSEAAEAAQKQIGELLSGDALSAGFSDRISQVNRQGGSLDMGELLKKHGGEFGYDSMSELQDALGRGDADANAAFTAMNQAISDEERALSDPMTAMRKDLHEINDWLRGKSQGILGAINSSLLWIIGIGSKILLAVGAIAGVVGGLKYLGKMFSGGGKNFFTGMTRAISGGARSAGGAGKAGASVLGKLAGPLQLAIGAVIGGMEAKEAGRSTAAGSVLGAATGGAKTGSMFSGALGLKKGGTADKTLGVAGGAAWGAAAGAAIGSAFFGVGAAPGAAIGAIVGAAFELVKIITEGTDTLDDIFGPLQVVFDYWWTSLKSIWKILKGIFTLDFNMVMDGLMDAIWNQISYLPKLIGSILKAVFIGIPKLVIQLVKAIFLDLPKLLWDSIKSAFESLSENEWVGPIFQTLSEAFNELHATFMAIYTPLSEAFNSIFEAFAEIGNAFTAIGEAIFGVSEGGSLFKTVIHGIATAIGWVLKPLVWLAQLIGVLLKPIVWLAEGIAWCAAQVKSMVDGIIGFFKDLWYTLVGGSIVPDLVFGIIKFFAMLPFKIMGALLGMLGDIVGAFAEWIGGLPGKVIGWLGDMVSSIGEFFTNLPGMICDAMAALPGMLWDLVKGIFSDENSVLKDEGDGTVLGEAGETVGDVWNAGKRMTVGAGSKLLEGDVLGAAGDVLGGAKDAVVGVVDGAIDTGKAVLSAVNPLNWFDEGTRKIASDGVAMLHEGEMVVPEGIWSQIAAAGTGAFGSGGGIWDTMSGFLTDPLGMAGSGIGGVLDSLNPMSWFGGDSGGGGGWLDGILGSLGLSEEVEEEKPMTMEEMLASMVESLSQIAESNAAILGAFGGQTVEEALTEGVDQSLKGEGGEKLKEGVKEGNKEATKEFGEKELLSFIAKDIGRLREYFTGEYSAMSDALMTASEETKDAVETSMTEKGALAGGGTTEGDELSFWDKVTNAWTEGNEIASTGDILGGWGAIGSGVGGAVMDTVGGLFGGSSTESLLGSALDSVGSVFGFSSATNKGAFGTGEGGLAGAAASAAIEGATMDEDSPLAGKKMPGAAGSPLMKLIESIESNVYGIASNMYDLLNMAFGSSSSIFGESSATNLGVFGSSEESIFDSILSYFGLSSVNDKFDSASSSNTGFQTADTSLAKSMYYDLMGGAENGEGGFWDWITSPISAGIGSILGNSMDYTDAMKGEVGVNPLDYTETMKGQVNPATMTPQQMENAVASRLMTAQSDMASAMDDEGTSDTELFQLMVKFLEIIAQNTTPEQFSQIVGSTKFGVPPSRGSSIKRTANDLLSSYWDIQHGEGSTGNVNTDGRGGK